MTLEMHLDEPLSDEDFIALEQQLPEMTEQDVADHLAFFKQLMLEGAMFGDGCAGCVFQAANGSRAAGLARADLNRRM